jgi:putative ABC transport system permease protein
MLRHYLLLSLKVLLRRKFFTFISIFGISFTLMVLMVVTAVLDHTFGPGKPQTEQARMLGVRFTYMRGPDNRSGSGAGFRLFDRYARNLPGVERLSIFSTPGNSKTMYLNGERIDRAFKYTDAEFWRILDFDFIEGAPYGNEDVTQASPVAVINRSTRARLFGTVDAVGRSIPIDDLTYRVVGVVEDVSATRLEPFADVWVPYTNLPPDTYRNSLRGSFWLLALADNTSALPGIREEFNRRLTQVDFGTDSNDREFTSIVAPFETLLEGFARNSPFGDRENPSSQLWRLATFAALVALLFLALPTVNLINLNISRIMERSSEIGVRKAFGAPARTLVGQFVVENVVLTLVGAMVGLVLSALVLRAINESGMLPYSQLAINPRVFVYGVSIAVLFGLMSGVYPAWRMARLHPVNALKGGTSR